MDEISFHPFLRTSFRKGYVRRRHTFCRSCVNVVTERDEEASPMNEGDFLAERFEEHRTHLRAVAYRMLGSLSEVDDAVQEAWLRLSRTDSTGIDNLGGWLTTVVARVCLDMLRSRQSRREEPFTPEAPEPVATGTRGSSPEHEALFADSV